MPTGFNALVVVNTFLAVLIGGTLWRLLSLHMIASDNPTIRNLGTAFSFQY